MTELATPAPGTHGKPWTCPFCPLLCDGFGVDAVADGRLRLTGSDCPRASAALEAFGATPSAASPQLDGVACDLNTAINAAAKLLATSLQPLFGGLATDVAGARALYRLACDTGAICDVAGGAALVTALRPQQDRGGFNTSIAEVRDRADLIVCVGASPTDRYPEFFRRCGVGEDSVPECEVVMLADVAGSDDLFASVAMLAALVAGRSVPSAPPALVSLSTRLHQARYAVVTWQASALPAQGALIVERLYQVIGVLNAKSRAAALPLGGDDGAATVNQVFTWLSGLPLRSRAGPLGLEHEPLCFDAARLLADGAVDALLWISSFGATPAVPASALPRIVLGHPLQAGCGAEVFIPVSTPGIGATGHLFRTDASMAMPMTAIYADTLPTVADVLTHLTRALHDSRAEHTT